MYYDKIRHRHSQVLAATGLTPVEFDALLVTFKYHWDEYYSHFTLEGKVRQRISYNRASSDTGRMGLKYACPKRNLKEKNLLRKKNRRIREFQALGLKSSMPSVE